MPVEATQIHTFKSDHQFLAKKTDSHNMARDDDVIQAYLITELNHFLHSSNLHAFQSSTCTNTFRADSSRIELIQSTV